MSLVEIGPRFVLTPIRIFEGAFSGATVYSNPGQYTFETSCCVILILYGQSSYLPRQYGLHSDERRARSTGTASNPSRSRLVGKRAES